MQHQPSAGRISMHLLAVDVTDLPKGSARRCDLATPIGPDIDVDALAAATAPIGYEVLTLLGRLPLGRATTGSILLGGIVTEDYLVSPAW